MIYVLIIVLSYMVGIINPAHLITKHLKKIDIRDVNSKNAGTSNVAMTLGLKYAVIVGLFDLLKGLFPVLVVRLLFPENDLLWILAGISAIIGHIFPIHMGFRGGKGTATFGGVCFALFPIVSLGLLVLFFIVLIVSDYIVVPTILAVTLIPAGMFFTNFSKIGVALLFVFAALSIYKHRKNIIRIFRKEEVGLREALFKKS